MANLTILNKNNYFLASAKVNYKLRLKKASDEYETLLLGELTRRRHPRSSWSFQEQFKIIKIKITQVALMSKNGEFLQKMTFIYPQE